MKITLLGTGTSHGVPAIGCDCGVCHSSDPRDRRTRPSILIDLGPRLSTGSRFILVDTSTDLRFQALQHDIRRVDAIFFTHSHADHVFGLDEIRRYNVMQREAIGCYASASTIADLRRMFAYIFNPPTAGGGVPQLTLFELAGEFSIGDVEVVPIPLMHGPAPVLGYRIGSFAYLTDCNSIPEASWPLLTGVRTLVLDALRERPHSTHFNLSEAVQIAQRMGPERTYFTHICHDLPHAATCARLPEGVQLAYDGLVVEV
jgi:phosphoribosyl 1,2-cyclic phosphate phosphodiesterase